jgi:hypothetical protein
MVLRTTLMTLLVLLSVDILVYDSRYAGAAADFSLRVWQGMARR